MDPRDAADDEAALRQYTFDVGDVSRDLAAVTVCLDAARARQRLEASTVMAQGWAGA